jgi:HD-GYP domain-containing protein (c-di-GMP phosphodiesterase class II)
MTTLIDLRQAIYALTDALDLVGVDEIGHGKRVGFMAADCGRLMGLEAAAADRLFHAALLHDCGVFEQMLWQRPTTTVTCC